MPNPLDSGETTSSFDMAAFTPLGDNVIDDEPLESALSILRDVQRECEFVPVLNALSEVVTCCPFASDSTFEGIRRTSKCCSVEGLIRYWASTHSFDICNVFRIDGSKFLRSFDDLFVKLVQMLPGPAMAPLVCVVLIEAIRLSGDQKSGTAAHRRLTLQNDVAKWLKNPEYLPAANQRPKDEKDLDAILDGDSEEEVQEETDWQLTSPGYVKLTDSDKVKRLKSFNSLLRVILLSLQSSSKWYEAHIEAGQLLQAWESIRQLKGEHIESYLGREALAWDSVVASHKTCKLHVPDDSKRYIAILTQLCGSQKKLFNAFIAKHELPVSSLTTEKVVRILRRVGRRDVSNLLFPWDNPSSLNGGSAPADVKRPQQPPPSNSLNLGDRTRRPRQTPSTDNATVCSHCGKAGHDQAKCWSLHPEQKPPKQTTDTPAVCGSCGKTGHDSSKCWTAHPELRPPRPSEGSQVARNGLPSSRQTPGSGLPVPSGNMARPAAPPKPAISGKPTTRQDTGSLPKGRQFAAVDSNADKIAAEETDGLTFAVQGTAPLQPNKLMELKVEATAAGLDCTVYIDTLSTYSIISLSDLKTLGVEPIPLDTPVRVQAFTGIATLHSVAYVPMRIGITKFKIYCHVREDLIPLSRRGGTGNTFPVILGLTTLQRMQADILLSCGVVKLRALSLEVPFSEWCEARPANDRVTPLNKTESVSFDPQQAPTPHDKKSIDVEQQEKFVAFAIPQVPSSPENDSPSVDLNPEGFERFIAAQDDNKLKSFITFKLKKWKPIPAKCALKEGAYRQRHRGYPVAPHQREAMRAVLNKLMEEGVIRRCVPDEKSFISPAFILLKPNGIDWRFLSDFRILNLATIDILLPCHDIGDLVDLPRGTTMFFVVDIKSAFHTVSLAEGETRKLYTIVVDGEYYEYVVTPQGAKNSPRQWAEHISSLLTTAVGVDFWLWYMIFVDDILGHALNKTSAETRFRYLRLLLACAGKIISKEQAPSGRVGMCGLEITPEGWRMDDSSIQSLKQLCQRIPTDLKSLRSALGVISYMRSGYGGSPGSPHLATLIAPFHKKLSLLLSDPDHGKGKFKFTNEEQEAWIKMITAYQPRPLAFTNFTPTSAGMTYILSSDASDIAGGGAIFRHDGPAEEVNAETLAAASLIGTWSHIFSSAEQRWAIYEREVYAIMLGLRKYRSIVWKHRCQLVVLTDNSAALAQWRNLAPPARTASRKRWLSWYEEIAEYDPSSIIWKGIKGEDNVLADLISRFVPDHSNIDNCLLACATEQVTPTTSTVPETLALMFASPEVRVLPAMATYIKELQLGNNDTYMGVPLSQIAEAVFNPESLERMQSDKLSYLVKEFMVIDGMLHVKRVVASGEDGWSDAWQLVVPPGGDASPWIISPSHPGISSSPNVTEQNSLVSVRDYFLALAHEVDHSGSRQTLKRLSTAGLWWPRVKSATHDFVRKCPVCVTIRAETSQRVTTMQKSKFPLRQRFAHLYLDHIHVTQDLIALTICDAYSLYLVISLVPNESSDAACCALWTSWIGNFGLPLSITTDRGPAFDSKVWASMCSMAGIDDKFTAVANPRANAVERCHRTVRQLLRLREARGDTLSKWNVAVYLSLAQQLWNSYTHFGSHSSSELVFGVVPRLALDAVVERLRTGQLTDEIPSTSACVAELKNSISVVSQDFEIAIADIRQENSIRQHLDVLDSHGSMPEFKEGQMVLIHPNGRFGSNIPRELQRITKVHQETNTLEVEGRIVPMDSVRLVPEDVDCSRRSPIRITSPTMIGDFVLVNYLEDGKSYVGQVTGINATEVTVHVFDCGRRGWGSGKFLPNWKLPTGGYLRSVTCPRLGAIADCITVPLTCVRSEPFQLLNSRLPAAIRDAVLNTDILEQSFSEEALGGDLAVDPSQAN